MIKHFKINNLMMIKYKFKFICKFINASKEKLVNILNYTKPNNYNKYLS